MENFYLVVKHWDGPGVRNRINVKAFRKKEDCKKWLLEQGYQPMDEGRRWERPSENVGGAFDLWVFVEIEEHELA